MNSNAATSSQASSLATAIPRPLYSDAIRSVIQYLNIRELHLAVQLSHQWHNCVSSTRCLNFCLHTRSRLLERIMIIPQHHSTVAKHVAEAEYLMHIEPDCIPHIARVFPNLKKLPALFKSLSADSLSSSENSFDLPHRLESLSIQVDVDCVPALLRAVSQLQYLRTFILHVNAQSADEMQSLDFSCLVANPLPQLEVMEVLFRSPEENSRLDLYKPLPPSLVTLLRSSSLTYFSLLYRDHLHLDRMIKQLTADPTPCPLIDSGNLACIGMEFVTLDRALLQSIIPFSKSLQRLTPYDASISAEDMQLLAQLPHLTCLNLTSAIVPSAPLTPAAILVACKCCPKLRQLIVGYLQLKVEELNELLSFLPELESLELSACGLSSLKPLLNHGLPLRLTQLEVNTACVPLLEVNDVLLQLRQLHRLTLKVAFAENLPIELRNLLTPGSSACVLPNIKKCVFEDTEW